MEDDPDLELALFPVFEDVDDVELAGLEELWEATVELFWAPEDAGDVAEAEAEVLEAAGVGFMGEELLLG